MVQTACQVQGTVGATGRPDCCSKKPFDESVEGLFLSALTALFQRARVDAQIDRE